MQQRKLSCDFISNKPLQRKVFEVCQHKKLIPSGDQMTNCYHCGIYISDDPVCKTYRSNKMKYNCFMDVNQFSNAMTKKTYKKIKISPDNIYLKYRSHLIEFICNISEKLAFSLHTFYLSIHYLDYVMSKSTMSILLYETYATSCLLIAAKAVELDERIPFISKLIKYCGPDIKPDEVKQAEKKILELLDWELQTCTVLDIIEFYLSQGVLFSNDEIGDFISDAGNLKVLSEKDNNSDNRKMGKEFKMLEKTMKNLNLNETNENYGKILGSLGEGQINSFVNNIENQAYSLLVLILKDVSFLEKDMKVLAAAFIAYLRKLNRIKSIWNKELFNISNGLLELDFHEIFYKINEKFDSLISHKKDELPLVLPKIQMMSNKTSKESYFSKISNEIHKATNFLLK